MLGKVSKEGLETLVITRYNPLKGYIKERNRFINKFF